MREYLFFPIGESSAGGSGGNLIGWGPTVELCSVVAWIERNAIQNSPDSAMLHPGYGKRSKSVGKNAEASRLMEASVLFVG